MTNYKKEINDFLEQYNTTLKEQLKQIGYNEIWMLSDVVYQIFDISLQEIKSESDYWIEAQYYSKSLGYNIVIDTEVFISDREGEFIKKMIDLKELSETIESKLKGLK